MGLLQLCKVVCDLLLNDRIKGERELLISSWGAQAGPQNRTLLCHGQWTFFFMLYGHYSSSYSHAAVQRAICSSVCQA